MATMRARSKMAGGVTGGQAEAPPSRCTTTLYDVGTAIQDVVGPEDDALVVATVVHLLRSGRLPWLRPEQERPAAPQGAVVSHDLLWLVLMETEIATGGHMGTALLIGIAGALRCLALGLGVFVLGTPPPSHPAEKGP